MPFADSDKRSRRDFSSGAPEDTLPAGRVRRQIIASFIAPSAIREACSPLAPASAGGRITAVLSGASDVVLSREPLSRSSRGNVKQDVSRNRDKTTVPAAFAVFIAFISVCKTPLIGIKCFQGFCPPSAGSVTAIVDPFSELSSTRTAPPCSEAISHTSDSPSPTPPFSLLRDLSTRKNG